MIHIIKRIAKEIIKKGKNYTRKKSTENISKERLVKDLSRLGLKTGDVIFLHSSLKSIGFVEGGPKTVINAIKDVIGRSGTIIVPTYGMKGTMYNTCIDNNYIFDVLCDAKGLGAIANSLIQLEEGVETSIHPTHSVSAIGKHAKFVTETHHLCGTAFGEDSPWEKLIRLNGKIFGLGVSMGPITFYHALEDIELKKFPLPVRMKKTYFVKCKDFRGNIVEVPINPLDPKYTEYRIDQKDNDYLRKFFWDEFKKSKIITTGKIGLATSWLSDSKKFYNHLKRLMIKNITIYSSEKQLKQYDENHY